MTDLTTLTLHELAWLVKRDWKKVNYAAAPYLDAMLTLDSVNDTYVADSGSSIVRYFLCNATSYSARTSNGLVEPKALKAELNRRVKGKY